MSSISREKIRLGRSRGSDEEFVLFLQGIPARCRWQELKDMVRQTALHIRQAVVYDDHHGFPTGLGQIIVKNEDEAWRTYRRLSTSGWEGQSLVVTLARTSSPTRPIAGPTKSPSCVVQPSFQAGYATPPSISRATAIPPSPMSTDSVIPPSPTNPSPDYAVFVSHQPFMPVFADPLAIPSSPVMQPSFCDPMGFGIVPTYAMSHPMHQPVISNSFGLGHLSQPPRKQLYIPNNQFTATYPRQNLRRSVVVQNLNPTTTEEDLYAFLQEAIQVKYCEIQRMHPDFHPQPARNKITARVTLRSAEDAKRAVAVFNNTFFLRSKIRVRLDRSPPQTMSYNLAPGPYTAVQKQFTPPATESSVSSSDTDELVHYQETLSYGIPEECHKPDRRPVDSCQPLVVNGSNVGEKTTVAT
ncbi:hypothetical protein BDW69DRAFT_73734 [Aspergillus filifer]